MTTARERRKAKRMEARKRAPAPRKIRCPECGKPATATIATNMARCPRGHEFKWEDAA